MNIRSAARVIALVFLCAFSARAENEVEAGRAFIPSATSIHGESRLVRRDGHACLQTLLHSASFRRGVREIQNREADVWPDGKNGSDDSQAFRNELNRMKNVITTAPHEGTDAGTPYTLFMEHRFITGACSIVFYEADAVLIDGCFKVTNKTERSRISVSDAYMSRAMLILCTAAFSDSHVSGRALLESAGWKDLSEAVDVSAPVPTR